MARLKLAVTVLALMQFSGMAWAADKSADSQSADTAAPLLNFQFDYNHSEPLNFGKEVLHTDFSSETLPEQPGRVRQYDAAFYYPVPRPGMNFGVGINIRLVNKVLSETDNGQLHFRNFNEAIPMFYATALFDLPFKGLSAGFEGRHADLPTSTSFDYKAKLRYEWNDALGFEGGWQHQQQSLDANQLDPQDSESSNRLYLDMRLNF